jgi:hypothetical protein
MNQCQTGSVDFGVRRSVLIWWRWRCRAIVLRGSDAPTIEIGTLPEHGVDVNNNLSSK